jgi:hypothetical protein
MTYWNGSGWEADRPATPPRPKRGRRFLGAATEAGLITLLMFGLIAGTTLAAKGGNGHGGSGGGKPASGSLSLVLLDGTDGGANYMERAAFNVETSASLPFVGVRGWQDGLVLDGYTGYFDSYMFDPWVTLGSPYWDAASPATCAARLFTYDKRGNQKVIATIEFPVAP